MALNSSLNANGKIRSKPRANNKEKVGSELLLTVLSLISIAIIFGLFLHWLVWSDDVKHYHNDVENVNVDAIIDYVKSVVYIYLITIFGLYMVMGSCYYIKLQNSMDVNSVESAISIFFIAVSFCFFGVCHCLNYEMLHQLYMAMYGEDPILLYLDFMALTVMVAGFCSAYMVLATAFRARHEGKGGADA